MPPAERRIGWIGPRNSYWAWILSRLSRVEFLSGIGEWRAESDGDTLIVALESRVCSEWDEISGILRSIDEARDAAVSAKKNRKKSISPTVALDSSLALLLGESWVGHRRTLPIPETFSTFYWYELYDRLLPSLDLGIGRSDFQSPERGQRAVRWQSMGEQLKAFGLAGKRIVVIADSSTTHALWQETLGEQDGSVLGVDAGHFGQFRYQAEMVLVDLDPGPSTVDVLSKEAHHQRVLATLRQVRHRYPEAMTAVASSFPRWSDWECWSEAGADLLFPKPGCLLGLGWCLNRWSKFSLAK